ncbi:MAG: protein translocase subunit SecD [Fidelibacterota bacterium]
MFQKTTPRLIIIAVVLLWAIYALYPTVEFQTLSPAKRETMARTGELEKLENRIIRQGLDLQGGMHIVLEVDIPVLIENAASNKNEAFYRVLEAARARALETDEEFTHAFAAEAEAEGLRLRRYFPDLGPDDHTILNHLRDEATDAINRALEILQNRVDQFGVSEPTIQKQGNRRIIVELAGIQDPQRARALLEKTALLEFVLLKDPDITQDFLNQVDRILRGTEKLAEVLEETPGQARAVEGDTLRAGEQRIAREQEVSLTELFGEKAPEDTVSEDTSRVVVDQELFQERPFSSLLRNLGGDLGVPEKNIFAVRRILGMEEVQSLLRTTDSRLAWSSKEEAWTTPDGDRETFVRLYHLESRPGLTGGVVTEAREDLYNGQPIVRLSMNSEGSKTWSRLTGANVGKRVAIVLDRKVHMAPVIRTKISDGRTQVEGLANMAEAKDIAIVLRAGALPAPVNIIEERTVGPSLGRDSIRMGTRSVIIGLVLVVIFMVVYYKVSGMVADFALIWNLLLVLAILAMLKATLTLPGIAGLILTVGMSVDANVIIFERIREELAKGKTARAAIDSGYKRAFTTIFDANATTFATAIILSWVGTGPVRGFGYVLAWGIVISFFTAVFVTRTIFNIMASRGRVTTLSI